MLLKPVGERIWTCDGATVSFYGFPYTTRMTVILLDEKHLWVHSPERLSPELQAELAGLGEVRWLISPNKLHHLYLADWLVAYPQARNHAAPGLIKKRPDIPFRAELQDWPEPDWQSDIDQAIFAGSPVMQEVVFFHRPSRSLILTDLIENFPSDHFHGWQRWLARFAGILAPHGKTPLDWRITFLFGKARARKTLRKMLDWQPDNIILAHGECIFGNGQAFVQRAFRWLN